MIPRLVHRIWLDDLMPDAFAAFGHRWADLHPGWELVDWRDSSALPPLRNQDLFDRAAEVYPADWRRFQADLLRLELLSLYGGVYVDTDCEPRRPLGGMLEGRSCVVGRSPQHRRGHHAITNAVMAAEPGHEYMAALIDGIGQAVADHGHEPLARSVGPWHLDRTHEAGDWPTVTVLGHEEMYGRWVRHHWNSARRRRGRGLG